MKNIIIFALSGILFFLGEVAFGTDIDFNAVNPIGLIQSGDNYDVITLHDSSIVTMTGGTANNIWSYDSSTIQLQNGNVPWWISTYNSSILSMTGGLINDLEVHDSSIAIISGGNITGTLGIFSRDNTARVHIYGENFDITSTGNGWLITGNWADNSQFSIFYRTGLHIPPPSSSGPYIILHEIPEPITIILLGSGTIIARRKLKK